MFRNLDVVNRHKENYVVFVIIAHMLASLFSLLLLLFLFSFLFQKGKKKKKEEKTQSSLFVGTLSLSAAYSFASRRYLYNLFGRKELYAYLLYRKFIPNGNSNNR